MKKLMSIILTGIMAATMIGGATVTAQAEEFEGFCIADVVRDAKDVESGAISASSIPLRIQNDICRIWINKSWRTGNLEIETEMRWGKYNPNPTPITEEQIEQIILGALK